MKINRIIPDDSIFTQRLANIAKPPKSLCYIGKLPETEVKRVAIVGSRKPTSYGREVTEELSYNLAKKGIVIISGLALGVDGIAHRSALEAKGKTVAVVVNKLPDVSPRSHTQLARRISQEGGAIISEYSQEDRDITIGKWSFLHRNRLVSGLSGAVIITEATARSGTLNTAGHALAQGRQVFVVPGNITSPLSAGCNSLIKQGASPVTCVEDILEVVAPEKLAPKSKSKKQTVPLGENSDENNILQIIYSGVRDGDEIQRLSKMTVQNFNTTLTMLEVKGMIKPLGANQWTVR